MVWFYQTRRVACVGSRAQEAVRTIGYPRDGVVVPHVAVVSLFGILRGRKGGEEFTEGTEEVKLRGRKSTEGQENG